jgi:hypothetical protein
MSSSSSRPMPDSEAPRGAIDDMREEMDVRATELVEGGIGLARIAVGGAFRTARWYASTSFHIAEDVVGALASGESLTTAANTAARGARDAVLEIAGVGDGVDASGPLGHGHEREAQQRAVSAEELRRRGADLLRKSSDVTYREDAHPAYARILESLAPDEARILRLLTAGPQPAVDVRASSPVPNHSELVSPGLSMVGDLAGCRYRERVAMYLNNLSRLGLVHLSREALEDKVYQVIEAQPDVQAAVGSVRRGKTIRRSIIMTPFGHDFVRVCLGFED